MILVPYKNTLPKVSEKAYVSENVVLTGDVEIKDDANIWYGVAMRGDINYIKIGSRSNVQDLSVVHVGYSEPVEVGDDVTVGHACIIHGCKIGNNVLVGMGSTIMNGAIVGDNCIIGAGSLVTEGKEIPSGVLAMGRPAKVIRELTPEEIKKIKISADKYVATSKNYKADQK